MGLLVRMIEKQKWEKVNLTQLGHEKTPADTITSDLRTIANTLSLWHINNKDELPKALIALAVGRSQLTRLDIMIFEDHELTQSGLIIRNSPENGDSLFEEYNKYHFDIESLDYALLGNFSKLIITNLDNKDKCMRFDKAYIADVLYEGYNNNNFPLAELSPKLKTELEKVIKAKSTQSVQ